MGWYQIQEKYGNRERLYVGYRTKVGQRLDYRCLTSD